MMLLVDFIASALGLAFGSSANVLIIRLGQSHSSLRNPSACTSCGKEILRRDNLPVVSWFLLRGRCRSCGARISAMYPMVELVTASLFLVVVNLPFARPLLEPSTVDVIPALLMTLAVWWLACAGVALAVIDFQTMRLPNILVLSVAMAGLLGLGCASILAQEPNLLLRSFLGALGSLAIFGVIHLISPRGMGMGDVKLSAALGIYLGWFGWGAWILGLLFAFLLGAGYGVTLLVIKKAKKTHPIAFGPWLIIGAFFGIIFGNQVWDLYLQFLQQALV